jgi:hypothetical protein
VVGVERQNADPRRSDGVVHEVAQPADFLPDEQLVVGRKPLHQGRQDGALVLTGVVQRGWDTTSGECQYEPECSITEQLEPTALTAAQEEELEALRSAIPTGKCMGEVNHACDPCLLTNLSVNGVDLPTGGCRQELCPGYLDAIHALLSFVDDLVSSQE